MNSEQDRREHYARLESAAAAEGDYGWSAEIAEEAATVSHRKD